MILRIALILLVFCIQCSASFNEVRTSSYGDILQIEGDRAYVIPEFWDHFRNPKHRKPANAIMWRGVRSRFKRYQHNKRILVGSYAKGSLYIQLTAEKRISIRGLRAKCSRTFTAGWDSLKRLEHVNKMIAQMFIPFKRCVNSDHIGIFFDGTGSFKEQTHTNIYRDYNQYGGNKFYYPGVGNFSENNVYGIIAGATWADPKQQFFASINQAYHDIADMAKRQEYNVLYIDAIGMSRGAAQSIELARLLEQKPIPGVEVNFLGLYEPVYSVGFLNPGQNSDLVESGHVEESWTRGSIPENVKQAAVLYGKHEERTWFSAAFLNYNKQKTLVDIGVLSGSHGSICGPRVKSNFQKSLHIMARSWMAERAELAGVPREDSDVLHPILNDIATNLMSFSVEQLGFDYDNFGAGAIQSRQGINVQWFAYRLLPWRWDDKAPLLNRYKRNFDVLKREEFKANIVY